MKCSFVVILFLVATGTTQSLAGEPDLPEHANDMAHEAVAKVSMSGDTVVEFLSDGESIIVSGTGAGDNRKLQNLLRDAGEDVVNDPVLLFRMLTQGKDRVPPGLARAWDRVKKLQDGNEKKHKGASGPPSFDDDQEPPFAVSGASDENNLRRSLLYPSSDWWREDHCTKFAIDGSTCQCHKWLTGDYSRWIKAAPNQLIGENMYSAVYVYRGSLQQAVYFWSGGKWVLKNSATVSQGYWRWYKVWGYSDYYRARVYNAAGDGYYWSMYSHGDIGCKARTWSCEGLCLNSNYYTEEEVADLYE